MQNYTFIKSDTKLEHLFNKKEWIGIKRDHLRRSRDIARSRLSGDWTNENLRLCQEINELADKILNND